MTVLREPKTSFLKIIIILFFIYNVNYSFIPLDIPSTYISFAVILLLCLYSALKTKRIPLSNTTATFFCLLLFAVSLVSYFINAEHADIYMLRTTFIYLLMSLCISPFLRVVFKNNRIVIMKTIGYAGVVNALFILSMLVIKPFQHFYLSLLSQKTFLLIGGEDAIESLMSLRMIGITGFSAYTTGFVQILCAISYIYFMILRDVKIKLRLKDYFILVVIFMSALVSAQSSLIGIVLSVGILMFNMNAIKLIKTVLASILAIITIFILIVPMLPVDSRDFFINWATEFFVSGTKTGSLQSNIDMYIYSLKDFSMFGESRWYGDNNDYFMNTDVGWYRLAFSIGIVGVIVWCFTIFSVFGFDKVFTSKIRIENVISIALLIYILLMMFKGAIVFDSFQSIFIFLIFNYVFNQRENYEA